MAKVTITIEDTDEGGVTVALDWDPPADMPDEDEGTTAQVAAMICMEALQRNAIEVEELED